MAQPKYQIGQEVLYRYHDVVGVITRIAAKSKVYSLGAEPITDFSYQIYRGPFRKSKWAAEDDLSIILAEASK